MELLFLKPVRDILLLCHELLEFWKKNGFDSKAWEQRSDSRPWNNCTYPLILERPIHQTRESPVEKFLRLLWYIKALDTPRDIVGEIYGDLFYAVLLKDTNRVRCGYGASLNMEELYALVALLEQIKFDFVPREGHSFPNLFIELWKSREVIIEDDEEGDESDDPSDNEEEDDPIIEEALPPNVPPSSIPHSSPLPLPHQRYQIASAKQGRKLSFAPYEVDETIESLTRSSPLPLPRQRYQIESAKQGRKLSFAPYEVDETIESLTRSSEV